MSGPAVLEFIRNLMVAVTNAAIYSLQHQQTVKLLESCFKGVKDACGTKPDLPLLLINDHLFAHGNSIDDTPFVRKFIQIMKTAGVESIQFDRNVTAQEIVTLVGLLARITPTVNPRSIPRIRLGTIELKKQDKKGGEETQETQRMSVEELPGYEYSKMTEVFDTVVKKKKLVMSGIREMVTSVIDVFSREVGTVMAFAPLKAMHDYTFIHSTNVCILNVLQARALGIDGELLHDIGIAAMLHDIGKMFIPVEILDKPGKPTEAEWRIIQEHPVSGAKYLIETPDVPELAVITAYEHHMKFNLSGYPRVAPTWKQHLCSQMTTLSDYFDAMRTSRAYRKAMDWDQVSAIMLKGSGTELHPVLVNNFLLLVDSIKSHKVAV